LNASILKLAFFPFHQGNEEGVWEWDFPLIYFTYYYYSTHMHSINTRAISMWVFFLSVFPSQKWWDKTHTPRLLFAFMC
jgi:hypothetical protein